MSEDALIAQRIYLCWKVSHSMKSPHCTSHLHINVMFKHSKNFDQWCLAWQTLDVTRSKLVFVCPLLTNNELIVRAGSLLKSSKIDIPCEYKFRISKRHSCFGCVSKKTLKGRINYQQGPVGAMENKAHHRWRDAFFE